MTTWNKQTSTILAQKSAAVMTLLLFEGQNTKNFERFICKLLRFLLRRRFCQQNWYYAQHYTSSISRYFFVTVPQEARQEKSWGGTSMRAAKRILWVFTACKQLKNRGTKCAFILVTVVQSSFHTEFLSSIRFSPLRLLQRRKRTRNFFAFSSGHEEELKLSLWTTKAN